MKIEKHKIKQKVWYSKWYKWIVLALFILLLLCILPKCCASHINDRQDDSGPEIVDTPMTDDANEEGIAKVIRVVNPLPNQRRRRRPIDPEKIIVQPDDPLNRSAINDLVNVYLMDFTDIADFSDAIQNKLSNYNLIPIDTAEAYKRIQFEVDKDEKKEIMLALRQDTANVKFVTDEWVYKRSNVLLKNDPGYSDKRNTWFYEKIGVFNAWNYTKGSKTIKIAVLDDGFDLSHKELNTKYTIPWNVVSYNDEVYADKNKLFHGTHVAGSIVAEADNGFGISGVAPESMFIPVQISDFSGYITISSILDGVFYALKNKADVINLSFGLSVGEQASFFDDQTQELIRDTHLKDEERLWDEVFDIAKKSNTIIVQAAGNDSMLSGVDPMKRSQNSIVVGALNEDMDLTGFTNYGDEVTVFAPGEKIYSSLPDNTMGYLDGTSMSSPIVAGCVALIKAYKPQMSAEEIIELVKVSASQNKNRAIDLNIIFNDLL